MPTIIYLHGFASIGKTNKTAMLAEHFKDYRVVCPDLSENPCDAIEQVFQIIRDVYHQTNETKFVLVGCSLGGFYAAYCGILADVPVMLINPSIDPANGLSDHVGPVTNYGTGQVFDFKQEYLETLAKMKEVVDKRKDELRSIVVVCKDDEVIPYQDTIDYYSHKEAVVFDNGGHRMTNFEESFPFIQRLVNGHV